MNNPKQTHIRLLWFLLRRRNIEHKTLCEQCNIDRAGFSRWMRGSNDLSDETLESIVNLLNTADPEKPLSEVFIEDPWALGLRINFDWFEELCNDTAERNIEEQKQTT